MHLYAERPHSTNMAAAPRLQLAQQPFAAARPSRLHMQAITQGVASALGGSQTQSQGRGAQFCRRNMETAGPGLSLLQPRGPVCCSSSVCREVAVTTPFPAEDALKAVLFDVDGTLCDSDPLHYLSFRDMLLEVGFQGGVPIDEEFFINNISGQANFHIGINLFPDWEEDRRNRFLQERDIRFENIAVQQLKPVEGLDALCNWVEKRGLKRAAVTNSSRMNAELMISLLGLSEFFEVLIIGGECERAKPFPDPYQKALEHFGLAPNQAFVLEDSITGVRAAVAAEIATVGVATRNPKEPLLQAGASFVIRDLNDSELWNALGTQPNKSTL